MQEYEFDADDSIEDHVPSDEEILRVEYSGGTERVVTRKTDSDSSGTDLDELYRSDLYDIAQELGLEPIWNGEGAHSEEELRQMVKEETED